VPRSAPVRCVLDYAGLEIRTFAALDREYADLEYYRKNLFAALDLPGFPNERLERWVVRHDMTTQRMMRASLEEVLDSYGIVDRTVEIKLTPDVITANVKYVAPLTLNYIPITITT
jgi:hypothetical protein